MRLVKIEQTVWFWYLPFNSLPLWISKPAWKHNLAHERISPQATVTHVINYSELRSAPLLVEQTSVVWRQRCRRVFYTIEKSSPMWGKINIPHSFTRWPGSFGKSAGCNVLPCVVSLHIDYSARSGRLTHRRGATWTNLVFYFTKIVSVLEELFFTMTF